MDAVLCHSSASYAETPVALLWEGERLEVEIVLERWRSPDGAGFRVQTVDGRRFSLFYNEALDAWRVELDGE